MENNREKRHRFSIRKFNVGVASVAIAAFWMVGASAVSADTVASATTSETSQTVEATEQAQPSEIEPDEDEPAIAAPQPESSTLASTSELPQVESVASEVVSSEGMALDLAKEETGPTVSATTAAEASTIASEEQSAEEVVAPVTRTAATTYRVQYINADTNALVYQQNYSVNEVTTAPAAVPHDFSVSPVLVLETAPALKGYTLAEEQSLTIANNAIQAIVTEKGSNRTLVVKVRQAVATVEKEETAGASGFRVADSTAELVDYETTDKDVSQDKQWENNYEPTEESKKATEVSAEINDRQIPSELYYRGTGPVGNGALRIIESVEFALDPAPNRSTFLVANLGNPWDMGMASESEVDVMKQADDYNERNGVNYYVTASQSTDPNDTKLYINLVDRTSNKVVETQTFDLGGANPEVNKVKTFATLDRLVAPGGSEWQDKDNPIKNTYNLNYPMIVLDAGEGKRNLNITGTITEGFRVTRDTAGNPVTEGGTSQTYTTGQTSVGTNNEIVYILNAMSLTREGSALNHVNMVIPGKTDQNNYFLEVDAAKYREYLTNDQSYKDQATGDETLLSHLKVTGNEGQIFKVPTPLEYDKYELVETPLENETEIKTRLVPEYVVGTRTQTNNGNNGVKRIVEIDDETGDIHVEIWVLDITKDGWYQDHFQRYDSNDPRYLTERERVNKIIQKEDLEKHFTLVHSTKSITPQDYANEGFSSFDFQEAGMISPRRLTSPAVTNANLAEISAYVQEGQNSGGADRPNNRYGNTQYGQTTSPYGAFRVPIVVGVQDINDGYTVPGMDLTAEAGLKAVQIGGTTIQLFNENEENHQNLYYYYVEKGSVIVHYETRDGKTLQAPITDTDHGVSSKGNVEFMYNTADSTNDSENVNTKPTELTDAEGNKYYLVASEDDQVSAQGVKKTLEADRYDADGKFLITYTDKEIGDVEALTEKHLTYVYEQGGDVKVHYFAIDENGNKTPLSGQATGAVKNDVTTTEVDTPQSKPGTVFNTREDLRPETITDANGDVWTLVADETDGYNEKDGQTDQPSKTFGESGVVEAATTKHINYYYKKTPKTGNVVINYVDTQGNTLKSTVNDTTAGAVDSTYDTKQDDNEYPEYLTKEVDGVLKTYKRVEAGDYTVGTVGTDGELTVDNPADETVHGTDTPTGKVTEGTKTITYVYEEVKAPEAPKTGDVVVRYHIVDKDGNVIQPNAQTEVKDTVKAEEGTSYTTTDYKPESIVVGGKTYDLVTAETSKHAVTDGTLAPTDDASFVSGSETGDTVTADKTKVVNYYYVERQPETPVTPEVPKTGNVVITYVDTEGNVLKSSVKDTTNGAVDSTYDTKEDDTEYPAELVKDGKVYKRVPAGTYPVGTTTEDGHLTTSDAPAGTVEEGTKTVTYVYEEVKPTTPETPETPKTGDVVVRYHIVDKDGNVIQPNAQTEVKDTVKAEEGTSYTTTDYKPESIVVGGKTYDLVTAETSKHAVTDGTLAPTDDASFVSGSETGDTVTADKTKVVNYYYVERQPETPETPEVPKTGDVVVRYHIVDKDGNVIQPNAQTEVKDTVKAEEGTSYTTTDYKPESIVVGGKTYDLVTEETSKHAVTDGTLAPTDDASFVSGSESGDTVTADKTKVVNYYYVERQPETPVTPETPKTGNVVITYVDTEGNVLKSSVKDTTNGAVDSTYDTKEDDTEYPAELVKDGKVYKRVPAGTYTVGTTTEDGHLTTSDAPAGTVEEGTKTVTYVYEEVKPTTPETPETPKTGDVVVRYHIVDKDGNVIQRDAQTEVKDTVKAEDGTSYTTTDYKPESIVVGGKTYDLVTAETSKHAVTDGTLAPTDDASFVSGSESGDTVTADKTKVVNYYYVERQPETPETPEASKTGDVVVRYHIVDKDGNVIQPNAQTEVKDTVKAEEGTSYTTTDYKPESIVVGGKTYDLVTEETSKHAVTDGTLAPTDDASFVSGSESGDTVTADKTKVVNYYYVERQPETPETPEVPKTGDVVVRYHIVDKDGNVIQRDAQTEVKDTVKAEDGTSYTTTDYKPATIVVGGKTYDLVTEETSKHAVTDGTLAPTDDASFVSGSESGDTVTADKTKVVNYYYVERQPETPETPEVPKTGNVVITYVDTEGNVLKSSVKDTTNGAVDSTYDTKEDDTEYPAELVKDGKVYKRVPAGTYTVGTTTEDGHLTTSDAPAGTVEEGTKTVTYVYEEVKPTTPETPETPKTGDVVVRYHIVDKDGNVIQRDAQTEVKDTVKAEDGTSYTTTDYKPESIVVGGKTYDLVTEETSKHTVTDGTLAPTDDASFVSGSESGDTVTADKTKVVNYYYVERQPETPETPEVPKTGNVVITYVDTEGNVLKSSVKDTTNGAVDSTYDTKEDDTEYPAELVKDGKVYKRVPAGTYTVGTTTEDGHLTTSDAPTGTVEEGTKTVTYVYEEVKPTTPETPETPKTGNVVITYVDTEGNVLKSSVKDTTNGAVDSTYDTKEDDTEYPAELVKDGKVYKRVPAGTYTVGTTTEDGHLTTSDAPAGTVEEGTKTVTYVYEEVKPTTPETPETPKTGDVVVRYHIVDKDGNVIQRDAQTEVKDTVKAEEGTSYTTTDYKPESIVVGGKTYDLVTSETSKHAVTDGTLAPTDDASFVSGSESGDTVTADKTKVVNYYYVERQPETPETPEVPKTGNVVITYVDTEGNVLKSSVKDTTNGAVDSTYDTKEDDTEYPAELVKDGKVYKRVPAGTYTVGTTTEDGHLTTSDAPAGTVEEGTKTVTYVYEEVKPTTPETPETHKTGDVVVRYHIVDKDGNVTQPNAQTEVKDTVKAEEGTSYTTTDYKPESIVVGGKTYDLVTEETSKHAATDGTLAPTDDASFVSGSETGDTVTADKTKVVNYYYVERQPETPVTPEAPKTGDVVVRYHIVDKDGNVIQRDAQTEVKDTVKAEDGTSYTTTDYKPATIVVDGKTYDLVTEETSKHAVTDGTLAPTDDASFVSGSETGDTVTADKTKVVNYYYVERQPETPETPEVPKTGNVVITYVDTEGNVLKSSVKDTTNGAVDSTYDTKEDDTEYPAELVKDGKVYKRVPAGTYTVGTTTEDGHLTTSDAPAGTVEEGTKTVTYVYEEVKPTTPETPETPKTGNVVITYVDTEGNVLKSSVKDTTNGAVDSTYDTKEDDTEYPAELVKDGKVYKRVPAGTYTVGTTTEDGHLTTSDAPAGTVEEGTKTVTYVYEEVKPTTPETPETPKTGDVVVRYHIVDKDGNVIQRDAQTEVKDTVKAEDGTSYTTTDYKPESIVVGGKTYDLVTEETSKHTVTDGTLAPTDDASFVSGSESGDTVTADKTKVVNYYYVERQPETPETPEVPKTGNVVITYVDTEGNVLKSSVKDTTNGAVDSTYDTKEDDTEYPAELVKDGKVYKRVPAGTYTVGTTTEDGHLTTSDAPTGTVEEGTKTVTYVYEEVKPTTPETPETPKTGNVVITYVDTEGNVLKSSVKDTTNGAVDSTYDTKEDDTEYPAELVKDGKVYKRVPAGTYTVGTTTEDGHLTTSDAPAGTVEEGTKTVTYVYEEVKPTTPETPETPKTGDVVITYVDTEGNVLKSSVKDTTNGAVDSTYDTKEDDTEYPAELVKDGKVYKRVPAGSYTVGTTTEDGHSTTSDAPAGTVEEGTKTVTYVYEEVKPTTPETPEVPKTGNVVITYVDTEGNVLKSSVKDTTNGAVDSTYDTKEDDTEYPAELVKDGKVYKRVPAGNYTVGTTTEDGHLTTSDAPAGTVEEGTKTVTYVYEEVKPPTPETPEVPKTGNVVITYVDTEGNVLKSSVKDTTNGAVDSTYDTKEDDTEYPAELVKDGKVYKRVPAGTYTVGTTTEDGHLTTSDAPAGTVEEGTKTVTYVYEEVKPTTPETPEVPKTGNVVITYVDTEGNVLKSSVKDTTNGAVDSTYDTKEDDTEYPAELVKDGKVYKRVPAGNYTVGTTTEDGHLTTSDAPAGTVEEGTKTVTYVYEEVKPTTPETPETLKTGNVVITYVDTEGNVLKSSVKDTTNGAVDSTYDTKEDDTEYPAELVKDGKVYKRVPAGSYTVGTTTEDGHLTTSDAPAGTVEEGTKTVTYVYEEVKPTTPETPEVPKTGNVVITYVDTEGNVLKSSVKDTTNGAVDSTYDTKEDDTEYPAELVKDGKVYKRVPAGNYTVGTTTEDGHLTTSDAPAGTVEEGTKTVTYVYEEVKPPTPETPEVPKTGNVVITYVDTEGNVLKSSVKDTTNGAVDSTYDTKEDDTEYPAELVKDGKVYKRVPAGTYTVGTTTEDGHLTTSDAPAGTVEEGTKTVTYVYEEVKPTTPETPEVPKTGNVVITYVDTEGNVLKSSVKDTTNGAVDSTYDTKEDDTEYPAELVKDGKVYKRVPAGTYTVGTTTEDGHLTASDAPAGTVEEGTKTVTYVYEEVKPTTPETPETPKTGNVVITYVDTEGNVLKSSVKDTTNGAVDSTYDTKEDDTEYPAELVKDGKVYKRVPAGTYTVGTTTEDGHLTTSDAPAGTVEEGTKTVTYVYEEVKPTTPETPETPKTGDVVVRYHIVDKDGNVIQRDAQTEVKDTVKAEEGTSYTTTDYKPESIVVGGKTYDLVTSETSKHAVTDGTLAPTDDASFVSGSESGDTVTADKTKVVNYYYVERQPETPETPEVPKTGNVVITYVDTEGNVLKSSVKDTTNGAVDSTYDTKEDDTEYPAELVKDGKVYKRVPAGTYTVGTTTEDGHLTTSDAPAGTVEEGTKTVTYVYEEVKPTTPETPETPKTGDVVITYVDTEGNVLKSSVKDTTNGAVDSTYDTKEDDTEYPAELVKDGKVYKRVPAGTYTVGATTEDGHLTTSDAPAGTVEEGTKTVTYVYEEVKPTTPETPETPKTGNVVITYVDTEGNVLKSSVKDTTNGAVDSTYDTKEDDTEYPAELVKDGKVYKRVPAGTYPVGTTTEDGHLTTSDAPAGTVEEGTKTVTYVYEEVKPTTPETPETPKTGDVVVHYVNEEGETIKADVVDTPSTSTGTEYATTDNKPAVIVTEDGTRYVLVPAKTQGSEEGQVVEGTTHVTYVYAKAANWIPLIPGEQNPPKVPYPFDPTNPEKPVDPLKPIVPGGDVPVIPYVPGYEPEIPLVPVDPEDPTKGYIPPVPEVPGVDTPIPYVPVTPPVAEKGDVVVTYKSTDDKEIKTPVVDTPESPVGTTYTTTDNKPSTITTPDGKTYKIVPNLTTGKETGTIVPGTTTVTYVYEEVKGDVVVHYVNEEGETIKADVVDTPSTSTGTEYATTDNKPAVIITEDGTRYVLVPAKTQGSEEGQVVEGTTHVTYVYAKAANWIPLIPGEQNPPKVPYPFDPTNPEKPVDPGKPIVPGGDVPVIPYVPGHYPVNPKDSTPLVPVDSTDPSKGYIPPVPEVPGVDTPIPYIPVPPTTPEQPEEPVTPTPEKPTQPVEPVTPRPVTPATPATPAKATLPNTGDASSAAVLFGTASLLTALTLFSRRRQDD